MEPTAASDRHRRFAPVFVFLFALAVLGTLAGERDLFDADEGRYGAVGRNVAVSGDAVVPRLDDMPFLDKPPLVYWIQAALLTVLPASPLVARAPTLLAGAIWVLLLFLFTRRLTGSDGKAWSVVALTATSAGAMIGSRVGPQMDMPLAACVTGVLYAAFVGIQRCARGGTGPGVGPSIGLGVAVGLGLLVKGPLVVAVPTVVAVAWLIARVDPVAIVRVVFSPLAWLAALVVATPWYVAIEMAMPGWIRHFVVYEHFGRFGTGDHRSFAPFWFYVPIALLYLVPWTHLGWGTTPAGSSRGRRLGALVVESPWSPRAWSRALDRRLPIGRGQQDVRAGWLLFGWFLAAFLLYSSSTRKLLNYLLPAAGPLFILAGVHLHVAADTARARVARFPIAVGVFMAGVGVAVLLGLWFPLATGTLPTAVEAPRNTELGRFAILAGILLVVGAVVGARMRTRAGTIAVVVGTAAMFWWTLDVGFARSSDLGSARELAAAIERETEVGDRVVAYKRYPQGLDYYNDRPVWIAGGRAGAFLQREIVDPYATRYWMRQERDATGIPIQSGRGGLMTDTELRTLWDGRDRVVLICRWSEVQHFGGRILSGPHAGAGRTDLFLIVNER